MVHGLDQPRQRRVQAPGGAQLAPAARGRPGGGGGGVVAAQVDVAGDRDDRRRDGEVVGGRPILPRGPVRDRSRGPRRPPGCPAGRRTCAAGWPRSSRRPRPRRAGRRRRRRAGWRSRRTGCGATAYLSRTTGVGDALVPAHAAGDVEDPDAGLVVDQLEQVPVAGDDVDGHPGVGGEGADDVVGLVAVGADRRDPERRQHVEDDRDLGLERVRAPPRRRGPVPGRRTPPGAPCTTGSGRPATGAASRCPRRRRGGVGWYSAPASR